METHEIIKSSDSQVILQASFSIVNVIIIIGYIAISIYLIVLLIKLLKKGIQALDIYINNNRNI